MEQHQFGLREWADLCERKDATIAALQARVQELEARQHFGACAKCLTNAWRICKEGTPDAVEMKCSNGSTWWLCDYCLSKKQLTQRTAELERVRGLVKTYADAKIDFDDKRLQEDHHAWRERYNKLVEAENALLQHRQGMEG